MTNELPETTVGRDTDHIKTTENDGGRSTLVSVVERSASRQGKPGAATVLNEHGVKVVAFEFDTGDVLADHAARHTVLIQVIRGRVAFTLPDGEIELQPGQVVHLMPMLRHAVKALEPSTLTVTMVLPGDRP